MTRRVQLIYFRQTGRFLTIAETTTTRDALVEIWDEIATLRRLGQLPGLRPGAGRDLFVVVDVPAHPQRLLHLVIPPFVDDDDVTPQQVSTGALTPLVRLPLAEIPRTTTRDVLEIDLPAPEPDPDADTVVADRDEITPVDRPLTKPPDEP